MYKKLVGTVKGEINVARNCTAWRVGARGLLACIINEK